MLDFGYIKNNGKFLQIIFSDISYIEAVRKYVRIVTPQKVYLVQASMSYMEKELPANLFCRIHRAHIVSLKYVKEFDNYTALVAGKSLPIGKNYKGALQKKIFIISGDEKNNSRPPTKGIIKLMRKIKPSG